MLRDLRVQWEEVAARVRNLLLLETTGWAVEISARSKNAGTLREKLQRLSGGLSTIRDLAGCRVVVEGNREEQAVIVSRLGEALAEFSPRIISRISDPRAGYRAIHIEIRIERVKVEIQVRTREQHLWAEAMERLGDTVGREIRYSDVHSFPDIPASAETEALLCAGSLRVWAVVLDEWEVAGSPVIGALRDRLDAAKAEFNSRRRILDESL